MRYLRLSILNEVFNIEYFVSYNVFVLYDTYEIKNFVLYESFKIENFALYETGIRN